MVKEVQRRGIKTIKIEEWRDKKRIEKDGERRRGEKIERGESI